MAGRTNFYSQLAISLIRNSDITNSNYRYRQFELAISVIGIGDIANSYPYIVIGDLNCRYHYF